MVARIIAILVAVLIIAGHNAAQQRPAVTAADYERAERLLAANTAPLVLRAGVRPAWLPEEKFWYRVTTENGAEFFMVDAAGGTKAPAFDHAKMAAALSAAAGETYRAFDLPFQQFDLSADSKSIAFTAGARRFTCALSGDKCAADAEQAQPQGGQGGGANPPISTSPDGKRGVFIRNYNLWMRDVATGRETQLTTDGIKDFGYATDNAGWTKSDRPVVVWSPDSKKVATFQHDGRGVGDMYLVDTRVGHPNLQAWKYPLPGDEKIFMIERVVIEVDTAKDHPVADAPRSASFLALRSRRVRRRVGGCAVESGRNPGRFRIDVSRSQDTKSCASRTRPGKFAMFSRKRSQRSSSPATAV